MTAGTVKDLETLEMFLCGRLRTAGLVAAGIAACACEHARAAVRIPGADGLADSRPKGGARPVPELAREDYWGLLDAEADARTPSPAQREASRRQGRALLRAARIAWPDARGLRELAASRGGRANGASSGPSWSRAEYRGGPHHAIVLGAATAAAGAGPDEAARIAAYQAAAGPVSAAVRLLALDPMRATGVLARLTREIDQVAELGAACANGPLSDLPCASAPALDLLAEAHIRAEVRLFES